jgi:DNA-binding LacI/PurR family transcriptional regulator
VSRPQPDSTDAPPRRATGADVARRAGVSAATVSYVINDAPAQTIPSDTRERVLEAARALNYRPSVQARALRRGRSENVLLLLPDWPIGPAVIELMDDLSSELTSHGLNLLVRRASGPLASLIHEIAPAGVVSLGALTARDEGELRRMNIPCAMTVRGHRGSAANAVTVPQASAGRLQVQHLAAAGHRVLGYAAPDDRRLRTFVTPRLSGVRAECRRRGLEAPVVRRLPLSVEAAHEAIETWRATGVTAVCAYNDELAFALLAGLRAAGLRAPGDLAVIGVDDIPLAPFATPPLTTIRLDLAATARHLIAVVVAGIAGQATPAAATDPPTFSLVVRASVGPAATGGR